MRRATESSSVICSETQMPRVAVERLGGPQRGALLLLAAVAVERHRGVDQLADGDDGAAVVELGARIERRSARSRRGGGPSGMTSYGPGVAPRRPSASRLGPAARLDDARSVRAVRDQRQGLRAPGRVEDGERLAPEDVGMPAQLDEGDRGVHVRRRRHRRGVGFVVIQATRSDARTAVAPPST